MPYTVLGLPTHALLIHATVVLIPLTTLLLLLSAFSGRSRARAGLLLPIAGVVSLILVPLTTSSGEKLQDHLPVSPAIEAHAHAARGLLPWAIALAVMTVAVPLADRFGPQVAGRPARRGVLVRRMPQPSSVGAAVLAPAARTPANGRAAGVAPTLDPRSRVSVLVAVLATVAAVGTAAQVAYIGHLGAEAAWSYARDLPDHGDG